MAAFRWYTLSGNLSEQLGNLRHLRQGTRRAWKRPTRRGQSSGRARTVLSEALDVSRRANNPALRASVLHTLMSVELLAGEHGTAIMYGWESVQCNPDPKRRLLGLTDLGGAFMEAGQHDSAHETLSLVLRDATDRDVRVIAHSGLAMLAASQGRRSDFEATCAQMEAEGWQSTYAIVRGQAMFERGLAWAWLGEVERAQEWFGLASAFAETHRVGKLILDVEAAIEALEAGETPGSERRGLTPETAAVVSHDRRVLDVQRELTEVRELTAVGA